MKAIYEKVLARLQTVPELKWVDLDKGQLELYDTRPPVSFPCALIGLQLPRTQDIGARKQQCDLLITIRLAFDFVGNTSAVTPQVHRDQSFQYFDTMEKVYQALQGWGDASFNKLNRQNMREERRPDGIKVISIPFSSAFIDTSAAG